MLKAPYITYQSYDFADEKTGQRIKGNNLYCLVDNQIVKVRVDDETLDTLLDNGITFGTPLTLDVRVKGRFAKYILAK